MNDAALIRTFAEEHSQPAFSTLVSRHFHLVYFAALRRTNGDEHRAKEVAQTVFTLLARRAGTLARHATLAGWLYATTQFVARDVMRTERRRLVREHSAGVMNELAPEPARDADWLRVRPVIDEALSDLSPVDRDAVLLRFFENRTFPEVGAALRLTENSARMRVDRALDKLRAALSKRGVTSTSAALAGALSVPAALAAPAGLGEQISASALLAASTTATAGGFAFIILLKTMSTSKIIAATAGAAAIIAAGFAVREHQHLTAAQARIADVESQQTHLRKLVDDLEWRLAGAREREATTAERNRALTAGKVAPSATSVIAAPEDPATRDMVETRHAKARELAKQGRHSEALTEFLWCFDTGMRQVEGYFLPRYAEVLVEIAELGKTYPLALEALRQRRDAAEARLYESGTDMSTGKDINQINLVLGENERTFALFDSFQEDDPRRVHLVDTSINRLIEARRYRELARVMDYSGIPQWWEAMAQVARSPAPDETVYRNRMRAIMECGALQIETRAGAGEFINAQDLIERVLVVDDSPETIATIKRHLERAGHPELFPDP